MRHLITGKMKQLVAILAIVAASYSAVAVAAYTRASSAPVEIDSIYANEWGSPFVTFKTQVNTACYGGNGLYLYNLEVGQPSTNVLRNNKMAMLLSAKMANKKVTLDYFYDGSLGGWSNCYIHGLSIVDQ